MRLIGLWAREAEPRVILIRSGNLAAPVLVRANIEVLPSVNQRCETDVYIVDGFVSSGMSGGLAVLTTGRGLAENALLGMVQGFWTTRASNVTTARPNGNLVYVVPSSAVRLLIERHMAEHRSDSAATE